MSNLFLFTGENHQALQEKLKFWEKAFIEKHSDNNLEVFDDVQQGDLSRIINAVDSQPFLAEKRMIIIKGLPQGADVKKKIELESLEPLLEKDNIPESSVVIFVSPRPDKRSRFFKLLSKAAQVETFELPKGAALRQWVQQRLAAQEKKITPQAIDLLLLFCAEDVNRMASEIEKLGLLQRDLIDEEAIELIVSPNPEAKIFKALDQIGKQSLSEVLKSFEELVRGGEEVMLIFFM
ncbi:MAG: DNA polymerase III subunit delta, partial [Candidatus Gracilibacteria bacterium]|nr:DNA polymerase III subunit delta [Candidatus Gracilibacteria bacterium]